MVNANTKQVVYVSPTVPGKTHDKKATDEAHVAYPTNATLDKDTGFQGYEPAATLTTQPKKASRERVERGREVPQHTVLERAGRG